MVLYNYLVINEKKQFRKKYVFLKNAQEDTGLSLNSLYNISGDRYMWKYSDWEIKKLHGHRCTCEPEQYEFDSDDDLDTDDEVELMLEEEEAEERITLREVLNIFNNAINLYARINNIENNRTVSTVGTQT